MNGFFDPAAEWPGFQDLGHKVPAVDVAGLEMLAYEAVRRRRRLGFAPARFVEVGCYAGVCTSMLAEIVQSHDINKGIVVAIDPWGPHGDTDPQRPDEVSDVYEVFLGNVSRNNTLPWIDIMRTDSLSAARGAQDSVADLVFIDADHSYESVKKDISAWAPKIRAGGILCGHDYGVFPGVTQAVNELGADGVVGSVWFKFMGSCDAQ